MRLIDEKGRLFGLVNVVDFLVVLFLLAMIPAIYFGYKIMSQTPSTPEPFGSDIKEITLKCRLIRLNPDVATMISVGDKETGAEGRVIGEITELGESEPYMENPTLKQRSASLKLEAQFKESDLYYKGSLIGFGSELSFETARYKVITKVEEDITKMLITRVTLKELGADICNLIAVGDKEIDATGQTVAEIKKVGKPDENSFELDLSGGNFTIGKDVDKKQLPIEALLRCQIINENGVNQIYFKSKRVKYNSPIEIRTDKYEVAGLISKTYELIPEKAIKWVLLKVKFSGVMLEVADVVKIGDMERDFFGSQTAKIVAVINNEPAEMLAVQEGRLVRLALPSQRTLTIALDMLCEVREGTYYFKNNSVKMGNPVTFSTDLYSITGTIIGMEVK